MIFIFLRTFALLAASCFTSFTVLANTPPAATPRVAATDRYLTDLPAPARQGRLNSLKLYSASEYRDSKNRKSLTADIGLQMSSGHHLYIRSERVSNNNGVAFNKYGLTYRMPLKKHSTLLLKTTNIEQPNGHTRNDIGVGLRYGLPTTSFASSIHLGYRNAESIHTQLEARYSFAKNLPSLPVRFTGNLKWRQRESATRDITDDIGGTVGIRYNIVPGMSVSLTHNARDDISPEGTSIAGIFTRRVGKNNISFKLGATNGKSAFLRIQSLLGR